jgi:SAM-dependent methyltransferase
VSEARSAEALKQAAIRQWTDDPAGALAGNRFAPGTLEFFEEVERDRYRLYPWLRAYFNAPDWRGREVLEIGVGLGTDHLQLARAGARLSGIDLTPRSIEQTGRRFELYGESSDLQVADAERLPFPNASFDAVYSFGVLHHTPGMGGAVGEAARVLRPGGRALVGLYNRNSYFYAWRLGRYLLRGEWRSGSIADTKSRFEHGEGNPLVILSSRRELCELFSGSFSQVSIVAKHVPRHRVPARVRPVVEPLLGALEPRFGWYWMVEAVK